MPRHVILGAIGALAFAGQALAHETGIPHRHPHDSSTTGATAAKVGPNGGQVAIADHHPIEMVASDKELVFYVQDEDGTPMDTTGITGRAIVTQGGKNVTVRLSAAAPNRLSGPLAAPLAAGAKVVFSAKMHGHNAQARFEKK
jgi:hypothetical protein